MKLTTLARVISPATKERSSAANMRESLDHIALVFRGECAAWMHQNVSTRYIEIKTINIGKMT